MARPTTKEAIENFIQSVPKQEFKPSAKLATDIASLRVALANVDTAGNKKVTREQLKGVLVDCGFSEPEGNDLVDGFFRIAEEGGCIDYTTFLDEVVRMCSFIAMRRYQHVAFKKDETKGEFDPPYRIPIPEYKSFLVDTGIGEDTAETVVKGILSKQIMAQAATTFAVRGVAKWYFYTYYPDEEEVLKEEPPVEASALNYEATQTYVKQTLDALHAELSSNQGKEANSPDNAKLHFQYGKLMAIIELAEAGTNANEHLMSMITGEQNQDQIDSAVMQAEGAGVTLVEEA